MTTDNPDNPDVIFKYPLGAIAQDVVTGFTGVITARAQVISGYNSYEIQPQGIGPHGGIIQSEPITESRLVLIKQNKVNNIPNVAGFKSRKTSKL